jgi:cobalt-zinc-cadmium efflux system protein
MTHHHHGHDHHPHHHHHARPATGSTDRAFAIGLALNIAFVAIEAYAGFIADSLALLADAGHNLGDALGLVLAWAALWAGRRRPSRRWTYGFGRSSIIAALLNAVLLLIAVGAIALEAVQRLAEPRPIAEATVIAVAAAGVVINGVTALLFMAGRHRDLNLRGAFLHMAADAGVSAGVAAGALLIGWTGWLWLDPAISLAIAAVITAGTWGLLTQSVRLALDAVPAGIDEGAVAAYLAGLPGVAAVHDLHIWPLSTTTVALTAHLVRPEAPAEDAFLHAIAAELDARFGIAHATLQVERGDGATACRLAPGDVV